MTDNIDQEVNVSWNSITSELKNEWELRGLKKYREETRIEWV